jgi:hypothetical protein
MKELINVKNLPDALYVELSKEEQTKLWQKLQGTSIKMLAEKIKIPARNLYKYKESNSGYPVRVLRKLTELANFKPEIVTLKTQRASEPIKNCKLPIKLDQCFAEFLGYLIGDGGIDFQLGVHFTTDDLEDIKKFKGLMRKIFGLIKFQFKDYKTRYTLYYPKTVGVLLTKTVYLPKGSKVDSDLAIPSKLFQEFDGSLKIKFIKAFYEADGFANEPGIGQAGKDLKNPPTVLLQIKEFLQSLGFNSACIKKSTNYETPKTKKLRSRWVLRIKDKEEKKKFLSLIAPRKLKLR